MKRSGGVFERRGTPIHYWISGPSTGSTLVLSHSACADHTMFDGQLPWLAKRYRVITWDAPGQGLSQPLPAGFTFDTLVDDFAALLDHLGVEKPVLVGHSMGGNLSQELVFRRPERASAMVLMDCTDNTGELTFAERAALALAGPIFAIYPYAVLKRESAQASAETREARERLLEMFDHVESKRAFVRILMRTTDCLHPDPDYRVPVPMLLLAGAKDRLGNIAKAMPRMAERNGADFEVVPGAGHMANMDSPEVVNARILRFLESLPR